MPTAPGHSLGRDTRRQPGGGRGHRRASGRWSSSTLTTTTRSSPARARSVSKCSTTSRGSTPSWCRSAAAASFPALRVAAKHRKPAIEIVGRGGEALSLHVFGVARPAREMRRLDARRGHRGQERHRADGRALPAVRRRRAPGRRGRYRASGHGLSHPSEDAGRGGGRGGTRRGAGRPGAFPRPQGRPGAVRRQYRCPHPRLGHHPRARSARCASSICAS